MRLAVVVATLVTAAAILPAHAQQYPNRPITMIVPFPPGGIADITGRPLAVSMSKQLGQPVVVENKAGAGGAVGHAFVAKAKPDGYTIMTALSSIVVIPEADKVNGRPSTYQMSDFASIALVSADPTILLVPTDSPWKTLKDLIDDAKARPGKISYASSGVYGTIHTCFEMLAQAADVKLLHVPYKGGGPAMTALIAGETNLGAQSPGVSNPHIKSGKIRVLGSWAGTRTAALPDVPTMKEQGFDVEFYIWAGVFAPAGLPADVRDRLTAAVRASMQDPEFQKAMANVNTPINYKEGRDFDAFLDADTKRLAEVVRKMGENRVKIVRFDADGATRVGALERDQVVEFPGVQTTQALIAGGAAALDAARKAIASGAGRRPLAGVKLLAPVVPATILCSGSNYTDHNKEKANTPISGKEPEFFVKTADCVIGPGDTIVHDERLAKKLDSETELAIVIGRPGRFIPVERALEHVFGYTIVNDVTARDRQVRRNAQGFTWYELGRGKAFDCSAPLGPCIVTADEIPDPQRLRLRTRINGELRQSASTGNMIFSCAQLIHFFSVNFTLRPGTVIITGTPGGTAWSVDPELGGKWVGGDGSEPLVPAKGYLKPGDTIECELEKIGVLRNVVGAA